MARWGIALLGSVSSRIVTTSSSEPKPLWTQSFTLGNFAVSLMRGAKR